MGRLCRRSTTHLGEPVGRIRRGTVPVTPSESIKLGPGFSRALHDYVTAPMSPGVALISIGASCSVSYGMSIPA